MPQGLVTAIVGLLLVPLTTAVALRVTTRRRAAVIEDELTRMRRSFHAQLAENHREHARTLIKAAEELFVLGHAETAAMLDMHATDFELRADDDTRAARAAAEVPAFSAALAHGELSS